MYHRIAQEAFDPWGTAVSPAHFSDQLAWLICDRKVLPLTEFAARKSDGTLPDNAVALTFDDGYSCNAKVAAPMLERFRAPATFFLTVDAIEKSRAFWWDELEEIVLGHDGPALSLDGEEIALSSKQENDRRWQPSTPPRTPRQRAYHELQRMLVTRKPSEIERTMAELRSQTCAATPSKGPMTPDDVSRIAGSRIDFGSHSLSHPWLTSLSQAEKAAEIRNSADRCATLTGTRPRTFAYPFGDFDDESLRLAEIAGYDCACSTHEASVATDSPQFALPRVQVGNWSAKRLQRALQEL
ncbi:MAG TPA: polysaccharide deacetylase family protein [Sphingomicrobium sp.]|nr:polysaccharide deacetylase family protein [Sphingomicrobium sp.]